MSGLLLDVVTIYVIHNEYKTPIVITFNEKTEPYIISSSIVVTDGDSDISFQFELFDGSFYSVNGTATDEVEYEFLNNVLTIKRDFIALKFLQQGDFVLGYAFNQGEDSVIGYLFIYKKVE